mmetsp:Transcript_4549/g.15129  ORF Transcript_4549/g.15129 Transcript_4549/m.15129 type:complete len:1193 (+) Transcript_4549:56-3634(+)
MVRVTMMIRRIPTKWNRTFASQLVSVRVDGKAMELAPGRLLPALQKKRIELPYICWHPDILESGGRCRACAVKVDGKIVTACTSFVKPKAVIETKSSELEALRQTALAMDPKYREKSSMQRCADLVVKAKRKKEGTVHPRTRYVIREPEKCNHCNLCVEMCRTVQGVGAVADIRGDDDKVTTFHGTPLTQSECVTCGQCINVCPTGALREASSLDLAKEAFADPSKPKVIQFAPSVRVALAEEFGMKPGERSLTREMVEAARRLGENVFVFDTNFAADLTIIEEGHELLERLRGGQPKKFLPQMTSCSPGWIQYCEKNYHDLLPNVSTAKSPMSMAGALTKRYWAEKNGFTSSGIVSIAIMPCVAKKLEADRPEFATPDGVKDVDVVLTTREFAELLRQNDIDPTTFDPSSPLADFDQPFGIASGAGLIFGATGGVMEAAVRTVYEIVTGRPVPFKKLNVEPVRGMKGVKTASLKLDNVTHPDYAFLEGVELKVAVAHGLSNAKNLCDAIRAGRADYHFVEIMCCPGGCLGGGGQPKPTSLETKNQRAALIYAEDAALPLRKAHENPAIKELYAEFLEKPMSHKAHALLHTTYTEQTPTPFLVEKTEGAKRVADAIFSSSSSSKKYPKGSRALLTNMFSDIVDHFGYVSDEAVAAIADHVGASPVNVESVLSHYHFFPRSPPPSSKTRLYLCESIHCLQHGQEAFMRHLEGRGIPFETTSWLGWSVDGAPAALLKKVGDPRVHHLTNLKPNDPRLDDLDAFENPLPEPNFDVLTTRRFSPEAPSVLDDVVLSAEDRGEATSKGGCAVSRKAFAMDPDELIENLDCAELRGCGGAGFPTHLKWRAVREQNPFAKKYVVVNADEGLPSTFKDYYLLRNDRTRMRMLMGAAIAAKVVGAKDVYVYLRYEYKNIKDLLEKDFHHYRTVENPQVPDDLTFTVVLGGGPYIAGEETALFESVEGNLPQPRTHRSVFPTKVGLFGAPTLISNVETFAWIPAIVYAGGRKFHELADLPDLGGAKLVSISGDVKRPTLAAIPMGRSLRSVLEECAGIPLQEIAACEVGGLTEALTYPEDFDQPLSLAFKPGHLTAGGSIVVFSKSNFDEGRLFRAKAKFYDTESCQLCAPCREGAKIFRNAVDAILDDQITLKHDTLDAYHHIFHGMEANSNCGHGKACGKTARLLLDERRQAEEVLVGAY